MEKYRYIFILILMLLILIIGIYYLLGYLRTPEKQELLIYSENIFIYPLEDIVEAYQRRTASLVRIRFRPAADIVKKLRAKEKIDLVIMSEYNLKKAKKEGLIKQDKRIAELVPVIMVQRNNPHNIKTLPDLLQDNLRIALLDEKEGAYIHSFYKLLEKNNISHEKIKDNLVASTNNIIALGQAVQRRTADITIIWRPLALQSSYNTEIINIETEKNFVLPVNIGLVSNSNFIEEGQNFMNYITGGLSSQMFSRYGF